MSVMPDTGLRSYDGNGVGSHRGEEEGYYGNEQYAHNGEEQVALHYAGQKNMKVIIIVAIEPMAIILKGMSRCVRGSFSAAVLLPFISFAARPTAA